MTGSDPSKGKTPLQKAQATVQILERQLQAAKAARDEPIAIVGVGCRLPGGVNDLTALGEALSRRMDAVGPIPRERFDVDRIYAPEPGVAGTSYTREGAFVGAAEHFDPGFFGISPREAAWLDPQHRWILECAWEALEDAGAPPDSLRTASVGVYVGIGPSDYASHVSKSPPEELEAYVATGTGTAFSAGRLSFLLGLRGPALAIDTACSSSLVALHVACQALRARECDLALAGGVQVMLRPEPFIVLSRLRALAPDGRCKSFSDRADGYGRGEGCAVLALKRLPDALRDGDRIHAIVRGTAVNHDGPSSGLTAPNGSAQRDVLRRALASAGVPPATVDYVEAHGTGTALGDPIEVEAIADVYGRDRVAPLRIGTVKSNIGHLESASGVAGVLKVVAALHRESIPPSLHADPPSSRVDWGSLPVRVVRADEPWRRGVTPRRAGISSFGMSGTNAHVILEEAPVAAPAAAAAPRAATLVTLSAKTRRALDDVAWRLRSHVEAHPEASLEDVAFSLATARAHHAHRIAVAASSRAALLDMLDMLDASRAGESGEGVSRGEVRPRRARLAFLFTGQGAQVPGMGQGLYASWPAFRDAFDRCVALFEAELARPLRTLMWALPGTADAGRLDRTGYAQPALFTFEYALAALWRSWGVEPDIVAGHSAGELVAACVAGVFSLEDAVRLVAARARAMDELPPGGVMVAVSGPERAIIDAVEARGGAVSIAAFNGPGAIVISGAEHPVLSLASSLASRGMGTKRLTVSHAFHSSLVDPMLDRLRQAAMRLTYREPTRPLVSNVSGAIAGYEIATPEYWVRHARSAVRFGAVVRTLRAEGAGTFIEIGPSAALLAMVPACLDGADVGLVPSLRAGRGERESILTALGAYYVRGGAIDFRSVFVRGERRVDLPTYPWQRERHWIDLAPASRRYEPPLEQGARAGLEHRWPLAGDERRVPGVALHRVLRVGATHQPFLADHKVFGRVVLPGAFHVAVVLAAAAERWPGVPIELTGIEFWRAKALDANEEVDLHVVLAAGGASGALTFDVATWSDAERSWITHAHGRVGPTEASPGVVPRPASLDARASRPVDVGAVLAHMAAVKIEWGPRWRWLRDARVGLDASVVTLVPTYPGAHDDAPLHPGLVDNGFAVSLLASVGDVGDGTPRLPFAIDRLRWWRSPTGRVRCGGAPRAGSADVADFVLVDDDGVVLAEVEGLTSRRAPLDRFLPVERAVPSGSRTDRAAAPQVDPSSFFEIAWEAAPTPSPKPSRGEWLVIGGGTETANAVRSALEAAGHAVVLARGDGGPAAMRAMMSEAFADRAPTAVVHLGSLEGGGAADAASLDAALVRGCDSVLFAVQAIIARELRAPPRLWIVTRGAEAAGGDVAVTQSPLIGLARVIAKEHAELRCTVVDLDPRGAPDRIEASLADALVAELIADDAEPEVALRGGERRVPRLVRRRAAARAGAERRWSVRSDGAYVVTGGLGGLGVSVAGWLVERGAGHVVLMGRTGAASGAARAALARLEGRGTRVTVVKGDLSKREDVERALEEAKAWGQALRGVVHAAGELDDGVLTQQTPARLRRAMAGKGLGALHLDELTRGEELDFFVLYASGAGLLGSPGQGNYAAANTLLDALSHARRRRGAASVSIDWGAFSGIGMASRGERGAHIESRGLRSLTPEDGLLALERALDGGSAQVAVLPLDVRQWMEFYPSSSTSGLLSRLAESSRERTPHGAGAELAARLSSLAPEERAPALRAVVRAEVAQVLRVAEAKLDADAPFTAMGMDSLMGLDLRSRLVARLGIGLSATLMWQRPTIGAVAEHLDDELLRAALAFDSKRDRPSTGAVGRAEPGDEAEGEGDDGGSDDDEEEGIL